MTKHGHSRGGVRTRIFSTWRNMLWRCSGPGHHTYPQHGKNYYDRGIRVCERWHTFENFLADMGDKPVGLTIERIDNNGNYEPGNCKWATVKEQARNRQYNRLLTLNGRTQTLSQWAEELGAKPVRLQNRLRRGWPIEKVLTRGRFSRWSQGRALPEAAS